MQKMRHLSRAAQAAVVGSSLLIVGCGGHGNFTESHKSSAAIKHDALKAATSWDMGHQAYLAGDLRRALEHVDQSIALNDAVAKSHVLRGRILLEMSRLDESLDALHRAETINPEYVDAQYYLGIVYERLVERDRALEHYMRAADLDPSNAQHVVAVAEIMMDENRVDDAREYIATRRTRFNHNAGVRQTLGHIALISGDTDLALEMFNEARLLAPEDENILEDLARTQVALGRYRDAEFSLSKLIKNVKENETRRDLQHMHARCLVETGRFVDARNGYLKLTADEEFGPADTDAWIGLGNVAALLKDPQRHRLAANRVMALAPSREEGYVLRALWHRQRGENTEAVYWLDKAIERVPEPNDAHMLRGVILSDLGDTEGARESLQAAFRADPNDETIAGLLDDLDR